MLICITRHTCYGSTRMPRSTHPPCFYSLLGSGVINPSYIWEASDDARISPVSSAHGQAAMHHATQLQPRGPGLASEPVPPCAGSSLPGKQPQTNLNCLARSPKKAAWVSSCPVNCLAKLPEQAARVSSCPRLASQTALLLPHRPSFTLGA